MNVDRPGSADAAKSVHWRSRLLSVYCPKRKPGCLLLAVDPQEDGSWWWRQLRRTRTEHGVAMDFAVTSSSAADEQPGGASIIVQCRCLPEPVAVDADAVLALIADAGGRSTSVPLKAVRRGVSP
jgi:hypothetical protein